MTDTINSCASVCCWVPVAVCEERLVKLTENTHGGDKRVTSNALWWRKQLMMIGSFLDVCCVRRHLQQSSFPMARQRSSTQHVLYASHLTQWGKGLITKWIQCDRRGNFPQLLEWDDGPPNQEGELSLWGDSWSEELLHCNLPKCFHCTVHKEHTGKKRKRFQYIFMVWAK